MVKDNNGNVINTRNYYFTNNNGDSIIIQDHGAGHSTGGQGSHFNVRPASDPRNGIVDGTQSHYPFQP